MPVQWYRSNWKWIRSL